jgi:hypothetical protein
MKLQLDDATKALPLAAALLYVIGFLVVSVYLTGYGAPTLEFFKIQYLVAGFWFVSMAGAVVFCMAAFQMHSISRVRKSPTGWSVPLPVLAGELLFFGGLAPVIWLNMKLVAKLGHGEFARNNEEMIADFFAARYFFLALAVVYFLLNLWIVLREKCGEPTHEAKRLRPILWFVGFFIAGSVLLSIKLFAYSVYPRIPFSYGGGEPRQVQFWLGPAPLNQSFLDRQGESQYSVPYPLLLENENTFVVISPRENERAIEIDRKSIGAVVVLGKRPKSAPGDFSER